MYHFTSYFYWSSGGPPKTLPTPHPTWESATTSPGSHNVLLEFLDKYRTFVISQHTVRTHLVYFPPVCYILLVKTYCTETTKKFKKNNNNIK